MCILTEMMQTAEAGTCFASHFAHLFVAIMINFACLVVSVPPIIYVTTYSVRDVTIVNFRLSKICHRLFAFCLEVEQKVGERKPTSDEHDRLGCQNIRNIPSA